VPKEENIDEKPIIAVPPPIAAPKAEVVVHPNETTKDAEPRVSRKRDANVLREEDVHVPIHRPIDDSDMIVDSVDAVHVKTTVAVSSEPTTTTTPAAATAVGTSRIIKKKETLDAEDEDENLISMAAVDPFDRLGLQVLYGQDWRPTHSSKPLELHLDNFGFGANEFNMLAIRMTIPPESPRFALNICPLQHLEQQNIYFHFNPRYKRKTELVVNDKPGTWGAAEKNSRVAQTLAQNTDVLLVFEIRPEGFFVFSDTNTVLFAFTHRRDLSSIRFVPIID
jgi:hypothetical protein